MDQVEKLFSALTPATLELIKEQIATYRRDVPEDQEELAWCDRIRETCDRMVAEKRE